MKRGRPSKLETEAREFGLLVGLERKPGEKLEAVFFRIRRRDPKRWGNRDKWWRLWSKHKRLTAGGPVALPGQMQQSLDRMLAALSHFNLPSNAEALVAASEQYAVTVHNAEQWLAAATGD